MVHNQVINKQLFSGIPGRYKKQGSKENNYFRCMSCHFMVYGGLLSQEHHNCRSKEVGTSSFPLKTTSQSVPMEIFRCNMTNLVLYVLTQMIASKRAC